MARDKEATPGEPADSGQAPLLSVSQFAARERVTRARVLQLLAARRIPGARRLGHLWAIPAASTIDRRRPGRPRAHRSEAATSLLRALARKYVWWLAMPEAVGRPGLVITQTMELGDFDDQRKLEATFGRERLTGVLRGAEPGRLSARSWTYWHYRLGLARSGKVPPLPRRRLR